MSAVPSLGARRRVTLSRVNRERLEIIVEHLLHLLDTLDDDTDLEDSHDDEPSDEDERSAQLPVTPDSTRPTAPPVWVRGVL